MDSPLTLSRPLREAMELPNGARFYRCALQVNPFGYVQRHNKPTAFRTEAAYNAAIVETCHELGVEVIGVTDHYRVRESSSLIEAARNAGIFAFWGFEAVTKDGVHFLCLFDHDKDERALERYIGECGIHDQAEISPIGNKDSLELLECAKSWGGICIAAHVASDGGGLLKRLSGLARANVWRSPHLLAAAIAGPVDQAPPGLISILKNKDSEYYRDRPIALISAQDVNAPDDLRADGSACLIKMSDVSVEGLRQAFLDPDSRIRLASDPLPEPHAEFVAISWEGGFLGETALHFSENLNVLVGGRGTGKSTVVESLRYILGLNPLGEDARKAHEGVVRQVLRSGTKISLIVRSHRPSPRSYTIERTVPNPPVVKDEAGAVLTLSPRDVMPGVEIFGQHEISELTKSPEKLTLLLERFVERNSALTERKSELLLDLGRSRDRIVNVRREVAGIDDRLAALPGLEETLTRFQAAGLEEKLKEKSLLVREERVFTTISERIELLHAVHLELVESQPIDAAFVAPKAIEELPNADILTDAAPIFKRLNTELQTVTKNLASLISSAEDGFRALQARWDKRRKAAEATYEKLLRELHKSKIDGEEFIRLRRQIEQLRPLRERRDALTKELGALEARRRKILSEWEDTKAEEYRAIEKAAKKVSRKLSERVRVEVTMAGNRRPLEERLRQEIGGNLTAALERLRETVQISLPELAARSREGRDALLKHYRLPQGAADRIAQADPVLFMQIEELELPATTTIELNTAPDGEPPTWQQLSELSTGQKATAVLLLLLLESQAPLVVDQPEDDLDNRFITDGVVPIMRQEKRRRQFIFSTHNANIPVLGDAELIVGLSASGEGQEGHARVSREHMGSIDSLRVRELVEEILEGGKMAFEMRRLKYGF